MAKFCFTTVSLSQTGSFLGSVSMPDLGKGRDCKRFVYRAEFKFVPSVKKFPGGSVFYTYALQEITKKCD